MSELKAIRDCFVEDSAGEQAIPAADFDRLIAACDGDLARLRRLARRRQLGEPLEYVLGFQEFRGRRFAVDQRVYITDPELTFLVDHVVRVGREKLKELGRPPVIVEFGVGCGSLSISVKKELPEARVIGIDLDSDAIKVAHQNAAAHHVDLLLIESDLFSDLPTEIVPDLIFGDPPWGDENSLYDEDRSAAHYQAMPTLSAFPVGGITAVHEAIIEDVGARMWSCEGLLNLGILGNQHVERLCKMTHWNKIFESKDARALHFRM